MSQEHPAGRTALLSSATQPAWPSWAPPLRRVTRGEERRATGANRVRGRQHPGGGQPSPPGFSPLQSSLCFLQRLLSRLGAGWLLLRGLLPKGPPGPLAVRVVPAQTRVTALPPSRGPGLLSASFGLERLYGFLSRFCFSNACFNRAKNTHRRFELLNGFNSCVSGPFISAAVFSPSRKETFFVNVVRAVVARQAPPIQLLPP